MILDPFASLDEIKARIERLVRGEDITTEPVAAVEAGSIPYYYGAATSAEMCDRWLHMVASAKPDDQAFYIAGAIGWASRP